MPLWKRRVAAYIPPLLFSAFIKLSCSGVERIYVSKLHLIPSLLLYKGRPGKYSNVDVVHQKNSPSKIIEGSGLKPFRIISACDFIVLILFACADYY